MLQAPTNDHKTKAEASSKTAEYLPEYEQSSQLMGGMGRSRQSHSLQQQNDLATLQKVYGNQAVLRMKGRSPAANPLQGVLQRKCACGNTAGSSGSCTECQSKQEGILQTKLQIGEPGDRYEQEADRVADEVMQTPNVAIQSQYYPKQYINTIINPITFSQNASSDIASSQVMRQLNSTRGGGSSMDASIKSFMESRFNKDFSRVRIHKDEYAVKMSQELNANAFTVGNEIYFNATKYAPDTENGKHLLAHELTHTLQQTDSMQIQRDCDPDFCTPYATPAEAASAKWWIKNTYMLLEGRPTFGTEAMNLYERFLNRKPGDSLTPVIFDSESSYLVSSFRDSGDTASDQDAVIDLVISRLSGILGGLPLSDYRPTMISLSSFLSTAEMNNRPINYSNPYSVAGHIAGNIGGSDAGPDYRKITHGMVTLEKVPIAAGIGYTSVKTTLNYEVFDAVDFCPGDCGNDFEQLVTIPMSRLEASGEAYDVPFKVIFIPESRSKTLWYS